MLQLKQGDVFDRFQGSVFNKKIDPLTGKSIDLEAGRRVYVAHGAGGHALGAPVFRIAR